LTGCTSREGISEIPRPEWADASHVVDYNES
jgi:hypothetical protein